MDTLITMIPTEAVDNVKGDICQLYQFMTDEWVEDGLYISPCHFRNQEVGNTNTKVICQHIYFSIDEVPREGDWYIDGGQVYKAIFIHGHLNIPNEPSKDYGKIVLSTDKSLGLPSPPEDFLHYYCDEGGIAVNSFDKIEVNFNGVNINIVSDIKLGNLIWWI